MKCASLEVNYGKEVQRGGHGKVKDDARVETSCAQRDYAQREARDK